MSKIRARSTSAMVRRMTLMASASLMSMLIAGEAQAQCVANPNQPLNAITTDSTVVQCTGAVNGTTITANANTTLIDVNGPGTNVSGATINANGTNNVVIVRNSGVLNGSIINLSGTSGIVLWQTGGISNNLLVNLTGDGSQLIFSNGSQVTQNPGQLNISAGVGEFNAVNISAGGGLFASGSNGQYLLNGGTGNQTVVITGTLQAATDGFAIALGDGDDTIGIGPSATISAQGGGAALFDGGAGNDLFSLNFNGSWIHNTVGFETININPNTAITLTGTNADATQVNVQGGNVTVTSGAPLGLANSTVDIAQFGNLTLNYAASAAFNHTLTGSGGLGVDSSGNTIVFGGNGTGYSGAVNISAGSTAVVGVVNALGTGTINNDGTLSFADLNLANNISGTGQIIYTGIGTGDLSGNNSFSGGIDIRSGSLRVDNVNALGTGAVTSTTGGVILQIDNTGAQTLANAITGGLVLAKTDTGVLTLTGNNTYTGGTLIDSGGIRVDSFARLGTGQVVANANGSLILDYNGAGQLLQTTPFMTGAGSFIKEGTGDVVINQASSYTGGTIIRAGRLGLNNGDALGSGYIVVDAGATLGVGNIVLNNDISGTGSVIKTASGTVEIYGDNSGFSGLIDVQDGALFAISGDALGSGTVNIGGGTTATVVNNADSILLANLTGTGNFEKYGSGRLTLSGDAIAFSGGFAIQDGILQVSGDQNLGTSLGGVFINIAGTLQIDTASTTTLASTVYGSGRVVKSGTGTVFVTGNNSYTGGTDIQAGAIRVTDTSFLGSGPITVAAGAALDLSIAGAATLNQSIAGAGILRKSAAGDLTLLGNSLSGGLDIVGGRVLVGTVAALGGGAVTTAVDTQLVFTNSTTEVLSTPISGGGTLTMAGTGLLVIQNANSFTGGTLINSGRIGLNNGLGLGTGSVIVQQGAILGLGGVIVANAISGNGQVIKTANNVGMLTGVNSYSGGTFIQGGELVVLNPVSLGTGIVSIDSGSTLRVDYSGGANVALNNRITGAGVLIKDGSDTVVINTAGNDYSGGTVIEQGSLNLNFADGLGTGNVTINPGATLGIGGISVGNAINGGGIVRKVSSNAGALTGINSYSGGTEILGGTLLVGSSANLGSGTVTIASGAELLFSNSGNATFTNGLAGSGTVRKLGTGRLDFTNPFSVGSLIVDAGRVRLNAAGTANVTVAATGALDGTGRVIGTLTNDGLVAPGNSIGTLTVQGNYVQNAGSVLEVEFDGAGNIDLLDVTGNATLNGGTIRFVSVGGAEGSGGTFLRTGGTVTGTFSTIETVGAQLPLAVIYQTNAALMAPSVLTARPSTFNAQQLAATDSAFGFIGALGFADARRGDGNRIWMEGFGAWADRSASGNTLAYSHNSRGLAGGGELSVGPQLVVGAAIGWSDADIRLGSNGGGGDQSAVTGALYARYSGDGYTLGGGIAYGAVDQATVRNVSFNGFSATVNGETDATVLGVYGGAQAILGRSDGWEFTGTARGAWVRHDQDGYTESGTSPLRLTVADLDTEAVEGEARLGARTWLWNGEEMAEDARNGVRLDIGLGARVLSLDGDRTIPVTFAASNAGITLNGDGRDGLHGVGEIGLTYVALGGMEASIGYRADLGQTDRHAVRAGISFRF